MKQIPAIVAAIIVTIVIGLGMFAVGANAFLDTATVAIAESPADVNVSTTSSTTPGIDAQSQAQIKQQQDLIAQYQAREKQYQDREKQYQTELKDAAQKLTDANATAQQYQDQVQQYQNVFMQLQQRGIIRVNADGQIQLPRR